MSRQSVVTDPAPPGKCLICGRHDNGVVKFIDFNFSLDYYGAVVVCLDCITESHELLGFVKAEQLEVANAEITNLQNRLDNAYADLDSYRSIVDSLSSVRPDLRIARPKGSEADTSSDESSDSTESVESESNESDSSGGLTDVSESGNPNLFG